jgi:carboxyl-terminal processing protease
VVFLVSRPGDDQRRTVALNRARTQVTEERASGGSFAVRRDDGTAVPVGWIQLPTFYARDPEDASAPSSADDVGELVEKLKALGVAALVFDLRDNPGGAITEAGAIVGHFIDRGSAALMRRADGRIEFTGDDKPGAAWAGPLVVLTTERSASASELVSGALQAYGRAIVVGETTTFGKGTAQNWIPLREVDRTLGKDEGQRWGSLRLTAMKFFLPDGSSTQLRGIASDIVLPAFQPPYFEREGDLFGALPWNRIERPEFARERADAMRGMASVDASLRGRLAAASAGREAALPEFGLLRRRIELLTERMSERPLSLNLRKRQEERASFDERRRALVLERRAHGRDSEWAFQPLALDAIVQQDAAHAGHREQERGLKNAELAGRFADEVYYHPLADGRLCEVAVRSIDLTAYRDDAPELAAAFTEAAGLPLTASVLAGVLSGDDDGDANLERRCARALGLEPGDERVRTGLAAVLAKMVAVDPRLVGLPSALDVPLREGLRVAADWAAGVDPGAAH